MRGSLSRLSPQLALSIFALIMPAAFGLTAEELSWLDAYLQRGVYSADGAFADDGLCLCSGGCLLKGYSLIKRMSDTSFDGASGWRTHLRTVGSRFFLEAMAFVTQPRPQHALLGVATQLHDYAVAHCPLASEDPPTVDHHSRFPVPTTELFHLVEMTLLIWVELVLDMLVYPGKVGQGLFDKAVQPTGDGPIWPQNLSQLLPRGPEVSAQALVHFCTRLNDPIIAFFVQYFFHVCPNEIAPHLVPLKDQFMSSIVASLKAASNELLYPGQASNSGVADSETVHDNGMKLDNLVQLLFAVVQINNFAELIIGYKSQLLNAIHIVKRCAGALPTSALTSLPVIEGRIEHPQRGDPESDRTSWDITDPFVVTALMERMTTDFNVFKPVWDRVVGYYRRPRCAGPACVKPTPSSGISSCELQQCSRCNVLYYCSNECQKRHWSATHKKRRADLSRVMAVADPRRLDLEAFGNACLAGGVEMHKLLTIALHVPGSPELAM